MIEEQMAQTIDDGSHETIETSEAEPDRGPEGAAEIDLERVRDLVLSAHPDVVPEMVQGGNFDELMSSVEPAQEAYRRIVSEQRQATPEAPRVAAQPGQRGTSLVDMESLSPPGKISEGLRRG